MNEPAPLEPRAWTARRWWTLVALVFLAQVVLLFALGAKKLPPVRPVLQVPVLQMAAVTNDEFMALNDPTLFAQPQTNDFGAAIRRRIPPVQTNSYRWQEPPGWLRLPPAVESLGMALGRFMQTNQLAVWALDLKPPPVYSEPTAPAAAPPSRVSTLELRDALAQRVLLNPPDLTNWPAADVILPSRVQVLVDAAGRVFSAVLLPADYGLEAVVRDERADQAALALARAARFAPAGQVTLGQMIFHWQGVPAPATTPP
jgi:hypothetical protein